MNTTPAPRTQPAIWPRELLAAVLVVALAMLGSLTWAGAAYGETVQHGVAASGGAAAPSATHAAPVAGPLLPVGTPRSGRAAPAKSDNQPTPRCEDGSRNSAKNVAQGTTVTEPVDAVVADRDWRPATIKLRYSAARQCAWGWVGGGTGATVWIERSSDGAKRLGERAQPHTDGNSYTGAFRVPEDVSVRACGRGVARAKDGVPTCTEWFRASAPAAASTQTDAEPRGPKQLVDDYLFSDSMKEFQSAKNQRLHDDVLDWTNDQCSKSLDQPFWSDFRPACQRHDFGYRNYKAQDRFNEKARKRIDDNFLSDVRAICRAKGVGATQDQCYKSAIIYHQAIRRFAGGWVGFVTANPFPSLKSIFGR